MHRFLLLLFLSFAFAASAKNPIGLPEIINYEKTVYNGGTQNWDIQQDRNGIMYFANNEGLLTFDGTYWKTYPLPNKTIVRSIAIAGDNKIYAGGQDEFGYFSPSKNGKLQFHSLKDKLPVNYRSFADMWDIVSFGNDVFFRTDRAVFKLSNNRIKVFPAPEQWVFLGLAGNKVIVQDKKNGLMLYSSGGWRTENILLPENFVATSVSEFSTDTVLLTTLNHGIFLLSNHKLSPLTEFSAATFNGKQILEAFRDENGMLIIGTNYNGLYMANYSGTTLYNFYKSSGLQNSTVLSIYQDKNKNIWLGLNNGIDFIASNNAIKHIYPDVFAEGVGHTSMLFNGSLYFGLSGATYSLALKENGDIGTVNDELKYIDYSAGQAWGMNVVNQHLLLGKHEGAFWVSSHSAIPFASEKGYWNFLPYRHKKIPFPVVLAGNYNGIDVFQDTPSGYQRMGAIKNFHESARFITIGSDGLIWASHPYKGVYKINLSSFENPEISLYTVKNGLPSTFNNHVYKIKDKIVVCTEKGIYEYNKLRNHFEPSAYFNKIFHQLYIRYLKGDQQGNIWFIRDKSLGVCIFKGKKSELIYLPELNGKLVSGFEHINPINKNNILVGAQKGFYLIDFEKYIRSGNSIKVQFSLIKAIGKSDSLLFGGYFGQVNELKQQMVIPVVKYALNSFHFEYSSIVNKNQPNIQYSYYLEGFDKDWSAYSKKTEKDYTNLPYGDYVFKVKARNNFGIESEVASYKFIIDPPWYNTMWAYAVYILIAIFLIYRLYRFQYQKFIHQQNRFKEEQKRLEYLHQLELDKSEKEIIKLKNEKLETEIDSKNSELASIAMHLGQKAELLEKIKGELNKLNKNITNEDQQSDIKKILRSLTNEEKVDEGWEQFSIYFDKVHTNFLKDIKSAFPGLTQNDLRLCAYLKMNLTTKEIAQLMQISPRGVEISRYRLRKKLKITGEVNLFEFFKDFNGAVDDVI